MNTSIKHIVSGVALAIASIGAFAQPTPGIDRHEANQQRRIDQGVASGELTRPEAHRLERQQVRINHAEARAKADGVVTPRERRHLQRMQRHASKRVYAQKHDAQTRRF